MRLLCRRKDTIDFHRGLQTIGDVVWEDRAMLESNLSACAMAGQYPERLLLKRRSVPNQ